MIKPNCAGCLSPIPQTEEWYNENGNFCTRCRKPRHIKRNDLKRLNNLYKSLYGDMDAATEALYQQVKEEMKRPVPKISNGHIEIEIDV